MAVSLKEGHAFIPTLSATWERAGTWLLWDSRKDEVSVAPLLIQGVPFSSLVSDA